MQRRSFLLQIAFQGLASCAPQNRDVKGALSKDISRRVRVIYADRARLPDLASLEYEQLGHTDNGVWIACSDDTVRALSARHPPLFLYFDKRTYDLAVAGLTATEVQEVIRRRRDKWSPQASGYVMSWLFDLERVGLEAALRMGDQRPVLSLSGPVEKSLALLQRLAGVDRYRTEPAKAMAIEVLEGEARLISTLQSALNAGLPDVDKSDLSIHLERRKEWTKAVSRTVAALGAPEFASALPFADPSRAVFLHPADKAIEQALLNSGETAVHWRDGVVFVLSERRLASLLSQERSVEILYAETGDFYDSVELLTQSQLHRDFVARMGRSKTEVLLDVLGQIDRLHLHQILMKRELRARSDAAHAYVSAGMDNLLREEVELLGRSLGHNRTFSASQGLDSVEPPLALSLVARNLGKAGISLFAAIGARHWPFIAHNLQEIQTMQSDGR